VSIALFRGDEVLLIKRARPPYQDYYSLPGGLVETGELLEDAARRELWEEVAMKAGPLFFNRHLELIEQDAENRIKRHYVVASFAATWLEGNGQANEEVSEMIWLPIAQATTDLLLTPGLAMALAAAQSIIATQTSAGPWR
jgi:ADP-ribose pyrophosphatase YjhB (NUDIX family)